MVQRTIDTHQSRLAVRTTATGLLRRLAHDLELEVTRYEGTVDLEGEGEGEGLRWRLELVCFVDGLRVVGVVRRGAVDRGVLSASEATEIERKLRQEVLPGERVVVRGAGTTSRGELTVTAPRGEQTLAVRPRLTVNAGTSKAECELRVSLARLGVAEVKGPLGAFKVADEVVVLATLALMPPA
ncbi:MAG: hypothetical protein EXR75_05785 [Myxococcales bacterium]|nr:hypothetical protein [Myxococcales bacterium]